MTRLNRYQAKSEENDTYIMEAKIVSEMGLFSSLPVIGLHVDRSSRMS